MKLSRDIDGVRLANHLIRYWSYTVVRQKGSHMRLHTQHPSEHSITIPAHKPLKTGMLAAILKEVSAHKRVDIEELIRFL